MEDRFNTRYPLNLGNRTEFIYNPTLNWFGKIAIHINEIEKSFGDKFIESIDYYDEMEKLGWINEFDGDFWHKDCLDGLEQCTGLKDKKGDLIYEGDWILVDGKYKRYIIWDKKESRFTSKYEDGQTAGFIYGEYEQDPKIEIIGNIHETKESK